MRAVILVHEPDGPPGEVGSHLTARGFEVTEHLITSNVEQPNRSTGPLPDPAGFDLLVIMGSVRSLTAKHEIDSWIHDELRLVAEANERNQPMLGICFGGQLLAEALGGTVQTAPKTEIGWHRLDAAEPGGPPMLVGPWMQWHHDGFRAPPQAKVLATSAAGQQLFQMGNVVGTQFHPEVTAEVVNGWLAASAPDYLRRYGVKPDELASETRRRESDSRIACRAFLDWFLDRVAFPKQD